MQLQLQLAWLIFLVQGASVQAVTLVAKVSSGGVKADVTFTQNNPGEDVALTFSIGGPKGSEVVSYQLHTFRLNYDAGNDRCSEAQLGPRLVNSAAAAPGNASVQGFELSGIQSLEGRSIAFLKTAQSEPFACATVEAAGDYDTAVATFRQGVLGHVTFRQLSSSPDALTRVTADLYSDGSQSEAREVEWRVVEDTAGCAAVGNAYNPKSPSGTCDTTNHNNCAVGDLTGKLGKVNVGATMGTKRKTSVDLNLPLTGGQGVVQKTVQLFLPGQAAPLACATIRQYAARTGITTFDNEGVTGTMTLTQRSPLDPTTVRLDLKNLRSMAGGYHVHKWPVPQRVAADQSVCSGDSVSGHFNPFNINYKVVAPPPAGTSTEDMYEVGDMSGVFGTLGGKNNAVETYTDFNLPLFGTNSVLGRSIVIHKDLPGAPRWICSNIRDTVASTFALATFTYPVIGHVMLRQRESEPYAETSVYVSLDYGDGTLALTSNHAWAVHTNPVTGDDVVASDVGARCASAGDVYNPATVSGGGNYSSQCNPLSPLRCMLGDLGRKLGLASVRKGKAIPAREFFTDVNLPLQGPSSVLGKAVLLKAPGEAAEVLACANVLRVFPLSSEARLRSGATDYGKAAFTQRVGVVQDPTSLALEFKSLSTAAATDYRVTKMPVSSSATTPCLDATQSQNVYNPFGVTTAGITKDSKPVGDLSAKFNAVNGPTANKTAVDPSLDLWGPRGITGRALTLTSSGASVVCANVAYSMTGGRLIEAVANFNEGPVSGQIHLSQYFRADGAMSPTTVTVNLRKKEGTQTSRHNWHTHVNVVGDDANASTGRCSSTGGHYNPFMVNVKANYSECSMSNPLRCELGDQANKLGTYDMGSGPMVVTDVYLPLAGQFGVIGRSFVVHDPNRAAPRLACADIMPADMTYAVKINTTISDKASLMDRVSSFMSTPTYNAVVTWTLRASAAVEDGENCREAAVYFLGMEADVLKRNFSQKIKDKPDGMSICGGVVHVTSLVVILVSAWIGRLLSE